MLATNFIGTIIDNRFRITKILGEGGMGVVFLAEQTELNRVVAIKLLHTTLEDDPESQARFLREGKVLSNLVHPNIVSFYQFGFTDRMPYMAMEYLEGKSLARILNEDGQISWQRAARIMLQICKGIEHAHAANVVHRDLTPSNIIIMDEHSDRLKLFDFGLATFCDPETRQGQKLTATGLLIGSVKYMSPEQCLGRKADSRSDIYSAAIIFYQMLNGAPPFDADSPIGLLHKHISEPAPQLVGARLNSDMPPELDLVIRKAMAKQPEDRYQSIADFAEHIALILDRREDHLPKDLYTLFKTKKQNNKPHTLTAFIGIALLLCILLVSPSILKQEKTKQSEIKIGKFDRKPRTSSLKKSAIKVDPSSIASLQNSINEMSKNSKFVAAIQYVKDWIGTEKKQGRLTPSKEVYAVVQLSNLYAHNLEHAKGADLLKNTFISLDKNPSSTDQDRLSLLQQKMTMDTWWGDSNTQTENAKKLITILNSTKSLSSLEKANGWFVVANAFDSGLKSKEALAALDKAKKANRFENKNYGNLEAVYEEFSAHIHYRLNQTEEAQNAIRRAFELKSSQKAILDSANPAALYEMQGDAAALGGWWQIAADMFALCLKDQNISRDKRASYLIKHASNLQSTWCCNSRNHGPHRDRFAERKEWLADQSLAAQEFETVARMSKDNLKQYREALVLKARCQIALEQFDEADKTIKRALKTGKQENDNDVRAFVANSLWCHGSGSQMNGFVPESVSLFQKSVEVYAGLSDYKHQEAQAKASLARALEEQKQWAKQHNLN